MSFKEKTAKRRRICVNDPSEFCFTCGQYCKDKSYSLTLPFKTAYHRYFNLLVGDEDKDWSPHQVCSSCYRELTKWDRTRGQSGALLITVPVQWREPQNHTDDCYFCLSVVRSVRKANRTYGFCKSATKPEVRPKGSFPPVHPKANEPLSDDDAEDGVDACASPLEPHQSDFLPSNDATKEFIPFSKDAFDAAVQAMGLSKANAELFGSILHEHNALAPGTTTTHQRSRHEEFLPFVATNDGFTYCCDIPALFRAFGFLYDPEKLYLCIDSGKNSLKLALLHAEPDVDKRKPAVVIGYSHGMPETYDNLFRALRLVRYNDHNWMIVSDLKVVNLLLGIRGTYPRYACPYCHWQGRVTGEHWVRTDWPLRTAQNTEVGSFSISYLPMVPVEKLYCPPLHVKIGLFSRFVQFMQKDEDSDAYGYLCQKFPFISKAKINNGTLDGTQIRGLVDDLAFYTLLESNPLELEAWISFRDVCNGFLGKHRADDYLQRVNRLLVAYRAMGIKMSTKVHLLHSHLDKFPSDMAAISDEHGERVHQELSEFEERYQGKTGSSFLADYYWSIKPPKHEYHYKRKRRTF